MPDATLPSGNGQTTATRSVSVVLASDHPALPAESSEAPATPVFSVALVNSLVLKNAPGTIRGISGRLDSTVPNGTYYLQLWNLVALPANATAVGAGNSLMAPFKIVAAGGDTLFNLEFGDNGIAATVGAVLGLSTTEFTATAGGNYLSATAGVV